MHVSFCFLVPLLIHLQVGSCSTIGPSGNSWPLHWSVQSFTVFPSHCCPCINYSGSVHLILYQFILSRILWNHLFRYFFGVLVSDYIFVFMYPNLFSHFPTDGQSWDSTSSFILWKFIYFINPFRIRKLALPEVTPSPILPSLKLSHPPYLHQAWCVQPSLVSDMNDGWSLIHFFIFTCASYGNSTGRNCQTKEYKEWGYGQISWKN